MNFNSWVAAAITLLLFSVVGMLVGIVRKSVNAVIFAVLLFVLFVAAAVGAVFVFFF